MDVRSSFSSEPDSFQSRADDSRMMSGKKSSQVDQSEVRDSQQSPLTQQENQSQAANEGTKKPFEYIPFKTTD